MRGTGFASRLNPRRRAITGPALERREARAVDEDVATPAKLKDVAVAEVERLRRLEEEALARVLEIRASLIEAAKDVYVIEWWERAEAESDAEEEEERLRMLAAMASAQGGARGGGAFALA